MFTKEFWLATAERAVKTFAQAMLGALTVATALTSAPWVPALQAGGLAAALSVLTSIVSSKVGSPGPSVAGETLAQKATVTVPADAPVVVEFDGQGADTKADAAYHGKHE